MAKQRCVKCGEMLDSFRMELMMGPKGFRRYAVHVEKCVKKVDASSSRAKIARSAKREMKRGV
jgi:predicted  nucleic acid-binding Zn-ribbon protein